MATTAIILAIMAPIVFMLSVLAGFSPDAVYIHITIIDLALLVGLYLAGTLVYHSFSDHKGLIIPNTVGFLMIAVILVVLINFLNPFLTTRTTFSVGTDRFKDRLGIGVDEKVNQAMDAAASADRIKYRFQTTNDNHDLMRDYTVTRVGDDYLIQVHLHAVPGDTFRDYQRIWILDEQYYTDFDKGRVTQGDYDDLTSFLAPALPPSVFTLPPEFANASWRALENGDRYTAIGTSQAQDQATLVLDIATGRLTALTLGSAVQGLHAEVRVNDVLPADLSRTSLEASLNQAIVVGNVDRSDAAMHDYIQDETFFVVRYPRIWRPGSWDSANQRVEFTIDCSTSESCPALAVIVYDLVEDKGPRQYAEDLGGSLNLQPEYRQVKVSTTTIKDEVVGVVEYLFDRTVRGNIKTTHHIEYIFVGQISRYHLDFSAPETQLATYRRLFNEMVDLFTYLKIPP
jgi:hypothetical protein